MKQVYAFMPVACWVALSLPQFKNALDTTEGYKIAVFTNVEQEAIEGLVKQLGYDVVALSTEQTIASIESKEDRFFICDYSTAFEVHQYFAVKSL